ncbi:quinone oxidoreductase-like protein 1 [Anabrus simplex]|uniref:quinone oxidoreductase-like protein 1 n=1 Tax=Anabrus simplex TaxID=316456 RepID=UPI0034DD47C0
MPKTKSTRSVFIEISKGLNTSQTVADQVELPELNRNAVLIKVKACGLASSQYDFTALGQLLAKAIKNQRIGVGCDIAGVVQAVGIDVTSLSVGDEVVGIVPLDYEQSGCSEYVILQEYDVVIKPENVSFVDAAGCIGDSVKAYTALHYLGRLVSGDTVLVLDGATSFGSICIQLAHHWGAKILTTSSSEEEKLYLQSLNIELAHIIELNHKNASLKSVVMMETGNLGVDIVVDQGVGQFPGNCNIYNNDNKSHHVQFVPSKHDIISCLSVGGRWVTSKANLQLDPPNSRLLYLRCASVGFLFEQAWMMSSAQQGRYQHILMDIMEKVATKTIRPHIQQNISFSGVLEMVKSLEQSRLGKTVMVTT